MDATLRPAALAGASWTARVTAILGSILCIHLFTIQVRAMFSEAQVSFIVAATAAARHGFAAATLDLTWHAPNATVINNLTNVLSSTTSDVYGFIYNNSYPTDTPYGTYNWCNMPHVRKQEYKLPSSEYVLKYVELIHRHHKRTVYAANSFPVESYGWNCDDEGLFFYGQPAKGNESAHTFWNVYNSPANPFKPSGFIGSCQFPQITKGGLDDSWQHGMDLYEVYHDLLHFLPEDISAAVSFRVTQNMITSQVAGMVINGMFKTNQNIPLVVEPSGYDSLGPAYTCKTGAEAFTNSQDTPVWNNHLASASSVYSILDDISGVSPTDAGFHMSFDHYYDNLSARQCHEKPLPCKLVNGVNSTICVTQNLANTVYRLGNWEYSYLWRDNPTSFDTAVGQFGVWIAELATHIRGVIAGSSQFIYRHNIAHDGSISHLLSFLQIDVMIWPGMGSEVVFEVWENTSTMTFYMRVLFGGKILRSSNPTLGLMDMVPLDTVLAYFDGLVGVGASLVMGKCNGTIPY